MERDRRVDNGSLGIRVRDGHKVTAHDDLAITVCHTVVTDLLDGLGLQLLPTVLALPVLAALGIDSGFPVNNPLSGLVAGRLGIVALVDIAAAGTGVDGIAHLRAGGSLHFGLVIMAQRLLQHSAAAGTELRLGAGGGAAGNVAFRRDGIQAMVAAAGAAVLLDALASAGGVGNNAALIPAMAQGVRVVRHEAAAAAIAAVDGLAAILAGGGDHMGLILVRKRGGDVLDMAVPADSAFPDGIAGAGTGGGHGVGLISMLALGGSCLLHLSAAGAKLQQLAIGFADSVTDDDARGWCSRPWCCPAEYTCGFHRSPCRCSNFRCSACPDSHSWG